MSVREKMNDAPKSVQFGIAAALVLVAAMITYGHFKPEKKPNLAQAFYSDDDGKTWFADSAINVPPYQHDGKTAVSAQVYTYANGSKQFCAYVVKYSDDGKKQLEAALAAATAKGQPASSVPLLYDHIFRNANLLVKPAGDDKAKWVPWMSPAARSIFSVHAPDGSVIDEAFVQ